MSKRIEVPYTIPSRWNGYETKQATFKYETNFLDVLKSFAAEETDTYGRTIAPSTLMFNIALRDPEFREKYNEHLLNKGTTHETKTDQIGSEFS